MRKLFLLLFLSSCANDELEVHKDYYLSTIDIVEETSLSYKDNNDLSIDVVSPTVYAVGSNNDFIIAKRHPRYFPNKPEYNIVEYYVIPLKDKVNKYPDLNKIGPLSEREFLNIRKRLLIPDSLTFTTIIKDIE